MGIFSWEIYFLGNFVLEIFSVELYLPGIFFSWEFFSPANFARGILFIWEFFPVLLFRFSGIFFPYFLSWKLYVDFYFPGSFLFLGNLFSWAFCPWNFIVLRILSWKFRLWTVISLGFSVLGNYIVKILFLWGFFPANFIFLEISSLEFSLPGKFVLGISFFSEFFFLRIWGIGTFFFWEFRPGNFVRGILFPWDCLFLGIISSEFYFRGNFVLGISFFWVFLPGNFVLWILFSWNLFPVFFFLFFRAFFWNPFSNQLRMPNYPTKEQYKTK